MLKSITNVSRSVADYLVYCLKATTTAILNLELQLSLIFSLVQENFGRRFLFRGVINTDCPMFVNLSHSESLHVVIGQWWS